MSFRSSELAIQPKTKARLRTAIKLYPSKCMMEVKTYRETGYPPYHETERILTADELGDKIINDAIKEKYPLVFEYEKRIAQVEREMIEKQ